MDGTPLLPGSPLKAGQEFLGFNPLGTEGAEAKFWLSASNIGRGGGGGGGKGVQGGLPPPPIVWCTAVLMHRWAGGPLAPSPGPAKKLAPVTKKKQTVRVSLGLGRGGGGLPNDGGVHADNVHEVREGDEVGLGEERRDRPELRQVVAHARHRRRADGRWAAAPRGPLPRGDVGVGQVRAVGVRPRVPLEELALRCAVVGAGVHVLRARKWGLSVGATCCTSSGSNGGWWVSLVVLLFCEKMFCPHVTYTPPPKKKHATYDQ